MYLQCLMLLLLFFSYLGDIECVNLFLIWTCTSVLAGISISLAPLIASCGIVSLCVLLAIHAFFLAAPNALSNVIMMEVVGMHRYAIAYGFSLFLSGSTSLLGYPLLGKSKSSVNCASMEMIFSPCRIFERSKSKLDDSICLRECDDDFRWSCHRNHSSFHLL